jgi:hypothetical protein
MNYAQKGSEYAAAGSWAGGLSEKPVWESGFHIDNA